LRRQAEEGDLVSEAADEMCAYRRPLGVPEQRDRHSRLTVNIGDRGKGGEGELKNFSARPLAIWKFREQ